MDAFAKNKRGVVASVVLSIMTVLIFTPSVFACSCPEIADPLTSLEQSTAVFAGRVLNISLDDVPATSADIRMKKIDFSVSRAWKGIERIKIRFETASSHVACGYDFSVGNEYLVYASGEKGNLQVSVCSRTQELAKVSSEEWAALREPNFLPEDEDFPLFNLISDFPVSSGLVLTALTGLFVTYLLRKFGATHSKS